MRGELPRRLVTDPAVWFVIDVDRARSWSPVAAVHRSGVASLLALSAGGAFAGVFLAHAAWTAFASDPTAAAGG